MNKEILEEFIIKGLSTWQISKECGKGQTTVRHWLKKYKLNTNHNKCGEKDIDDKRYNQTHRECIKCNQILEINNFYKKAGILFDSTYCKICTNNQTTIRMVNFKKKCLEYKGQKCVECGYSKYYGALEFHHIDPRKKDFSISQMKSYSFDNIVKEELDKCVLLCANCHREVESGIIILTDKQKSV